MREKERETVREKEIEERRGKEKDGMEEIKKNRDGGRM